MSRRQASPVTTYIGNKAAQSLEWMYKRSHYVISPDHFNQSFAKPRRL